MFIPGRIEVLGKHTDYCGGSSIVCEIERGFHATVGTFSESRLLLEIRLQNRVIGRITRSKSCGV